MYFLEMKKNNNWNKKLINEVVRRSGIGHKSISELNDRAKVRPDAFWGAKYQFGRKSFA